MITHLVLAVSMAISGRHVSAEETCTIYSIKSDGVEIAETAAQKYAQAFGPNALDAVLYVHNGKLGWIQTYYRRPANADEAVDFFKSRGSFTVVHLGTKGILPHCLASLPEWQLERVEFAVFYAAGGFRVYLKPCLPEAHVIAIRDAVSRCP